MPGMLAARFYQAGLPLRIEEIPIPTAGRGEVLLRVKANGVCGSDLHIMEGVTPVGFTPITLGHEFAGVIEEVGPGVEGWAPGDRATVFAVVSCESCDPCLKGRRSICTARRLLGIHLNGGLAEYAVVPAKNLVRLPDNFPFAEGAIIVDAVLTPYHALFGRGQVTAGQSIAIFGVGGLGMHAVKLAKIAGAVPIIAVDVNEHALKRAQEAGADVVVNSSAETPSEVIKKLTGGQGVDAALEFIGLGETVRQAAQSVKNGGRAVIVGLGTDEVAAQPLTVFVRNEITIMGSYGGEIFEVQEIVQLVASGRLKLSCSISEVFPLREVNTAMEHLRNKQSNPVRIVVAPG